MNEIGLIYKGKKKPFQYDNPRTGKLKFTPGAITWVPVKAAEFLMSVNPQMFTKSGERGAGISDEFVEIKDAADIIKKKAERDAEENEALETTEIETEVEPENTASEAEGSDFLPPCPKCGRKYHKKYQKWHDQHIDKCEG